METTSSNALLSCDGLGGYNWSDQADEGLNYALMAFTSSNSDSKGNPQIDLQDRGVIDSGCSKYMTGNMSYLTDYKEIDGGYVAFRGNPRGGKIIGKATKDETSGILKSFITRIKNLVDHKVKVIRYDNGTEFKNREMNQFCKMKGILRQFSVARTPQQNGVAKRRNRTIIEDARTMLADLKLLTTFWAEAVNTVCYVQNKVLVVKPHNKTIYELFMADEGFFVGYSLNSKAFKVFNNRIRIVEENLHIRFSENTPNIVGTKASDNAGQAKIETEPIKDYILLPLWTADLPFSKDPKSLMMMDLNLQVMMEEDNELPFDPNMPALEDVSIFIFSNNDEDNDIVADINNMDTIIQMDVKSVFLYEKIEEEVYVCQSPGFEDLDFFDRVYKVEKALYGLHQAPRAWYETLSTYLLDNGFQRGKIVKILYIKRHKGDILLMSSMGELTFFLGLQVKQKKDETFISQDKYVAKILKKFGFTKVKIASTPMETQKPLLKDEDGEEVDVHMYSDYAGASLDRKSTTGGCQFLGCRLISWQYKK
nr:ribonuclease H-like domain, reverse transcriptase, RNA-dependent DNA polymerase [Tanacetum cinerariifolium]